MKVEIKQGHVLEMLRGMADESVHMAVTSPPYWGLRQYAGVEPLVWAPEGWPEDRPVESCRHDWGAEERGKRKDIKPPEQSTSQSRMGVDERQGLGPPSGGRFCFWCRAWLGNLGQEPTIALYVRHLIEIFREMRRVLRSDGTCWLNVGDSFVADTSRSTKNRHSHRRDRIPRQERVEGIERKNLCLVPERLAIALQEDGWIVRQRIIWHKPTCMPESTKDRPTTDHETVWLLAKSPRYFFDWFAVREATTGGAHDRGSGVNPKAALKQPGETRQNGSFSGVVREVRSRRQMRSVWRMTTEGTTEAHYAAYPTELPARAIRAGTSEYGVCAECGAPWMRVVKRTAVGDWHVDPQHKHDAGALHQTAAWAKNGYGGKWADQDANSSGRRALANMAAARAAGGAHDNPFAEPVHQGWRAGCDCSRAFYERAFPRTRRKRKRRRQDRSGVWLARVRRHWPTAMPGRAAAVVLDPFLGSGTTAIAAVKLAREAVGIELSPEYVAISRRRVRGLLGVELAGPSEPFEKDWAALPLFR